MVVQKKPPHAPTGSGVTRRRNRSAASGAMSQRTFTSDLPRECARGERPVKLTSWTPERRDQFPPRLAGGYSLGDARAVSLVTFPVGSEILDHQAVAGSARSG